MTRQSLATFRQTVTVAWPQQSQQDAKTLLLKIAREGNAQTVREQTMRAGVNPDVSAYANQPGNTNLENVVLPGPIVYSYDYRREIVEVALGELYKASPVDSGAYVSSHTIFLNGQPVDHLPPQLSPDDEIWLSNPVPYARRLEIGKTKSGRDFPIQVPNRIYERVAKNILARRYGNSAKITFDYIAIPEAHVIKGKLSSHYGTGKKLGPRGGGLSRKRRQQPGTTVRAPAIIIEALA